MRRGCGSDRMDGQTEPAGSGNECVRTNNDFQVLTEYCSCSQDACNGSVQPKAGRLIGWLLFGLLAAVGVALDRRVR